MIDQMIRCKDLMAYDHIGSLNEWFLKCPPEGKEKHWKDGRSAKETAKHWLHTIPSQFKSILSELDLKFKICSPEFVSRFDEYGGNGRNHDLVIITENIAGEKVLIAIESKADEEFGPTISEAIQNAEIRYQQNPRSNGLRRIQELRFALFGSHLDEQHLPLRYQLLTAVAGTLSEAKIQNASKAIFIVQTFLSDETNWNNFHRNEDDLKLVCT